MRLVDQGKLDSDPDFLVFMRAVFRRLDSLGKIHDQGGLGIDFQSHLEAASQVKIYESHIRWHDWERYSSSQDRFMKLGGIIGEIYYTGDFAMLLPYLKMAENLHVGKGTSFGLGRYKMMISADH